jgi:hypothetical protein
MDFVNRMDAEVQVMTGRSIVRRKPELKSHRSIGSFIARVAADLV